MKKRDRRQEFDEYFREVYGPRWDALRAALAGEAVKTTMSNPFGGGLADYSLDPASLLPARWLAPRAGDRVADFCASPGGKSLAMIFALRDAAEWHLNDLSPGRVTRLKAVLHDCLPPELLARVHVTRGDASRWGQSRPREFDRILVDAPCSGERHLLAAPAELARWSRKGVKGLAVRQHALLCAALDALKPGGRLVYSTCSINPLENDAVIARLAESRGGKFRALEARDGMGEPTAHGWIVLPDRFAGGPIYAALLERADG